MLNRADGIMADDPDCMPPGLAVAHPLKLKAKGQITVQEFLNLTKDLPGSDPE